MSQPEPTSTDSTTPRGPEVAAALAPPAPDISQLRDGSLPEAPFPGGRDLDFRIFLAPEVHQAVWSHGQANTSVEICGVLVGRWGRDADGPFVNVTGSIAGNAAESKFAEVTFTHQTWNTINDEMDRNYPDLTIVGWYHTHPDFGVFLSDRDVFIQQHFFSEAGHIAHVIDPIRRTEGIFVWRRGKPTLTPHFWVGSELKTSTAAGAESGPSSRSEAATTTLSQQPVSPRGSFLPPIEQLLAYLALLLMGYLIASFRTTWDQTRLIEGTVAHYGLWQGLRPGLGDNLDQVADRLKQVSARLEILAVDHLKRFDKDDRRPETRKEWDAVREVLAESTLNLAKIKGAYDLSPTEALVVREQILRKIQELGPQPPTTSPDRPKIEPKSEKPEKSAADAVSKKS